MVDTYYLAEAKDTRFKRALEPKFDDRLVTSMVISLRPQWRLSHHQYDATTGHALLS